jgi:hypothetical protein
MDAVDNVEIEDRADVGMIERGREPRFTLKAFQICFLGRQFRWQDFDNNRPSKFGIYGFVDSALPARTELFENLVIP